jgi:hypothetical protein
MAHSLFLAPAVSAPLTANWTTLGQCWKYLETALNSMD